MKVYIEDIVKTVIFRKQLNKTDLSEIEFYRGDVRVKIKQSIIDEWDFTGLSNMDFASMNLLLESEYNQINSLTKEDN